MFKLIFKINKELIYFFTILIMCISSYCISNNFDNLNGITALVVVGFGGESPEKINLSDKTIRNILEKNLRICGINNGIKDSVYMCVEVSIIENGNVFAAHLDLKFVETGILNKNKLRASCERWAKKHMFISDNPKQMGKEIVYVINRWMDEFSNLYLEANPKIFIEIDSKP